MVTLIILILPIHEHAIYNFPFVCNIFNFFHQYFAVSEYRYSTFLIRFIPRYFILSDAIVNGFLFFFLIVVSV